MGYDFGVYLYDRNAAIYILFRLGSFLCFAMLQNIAGPNQSFTKYVAGTLVQNKRSFENVQKIYYTLHEEDNTEFVENVDKWVKEHFTETNLKRIRIAYGITQAELAKQSGISVRSIRMYDLRNKGINKAGVDYSQLCKSAWLYYREFRQEGNSWG